MRRAVIRAVLFPLLFFDKAYYWNQGVFFLAFENISVAVSCLREESNAADCDSHTSRGYIKWTRKISLYLRFGRTFSARA